MYSCLQNRHQKKSAFDSIPGNVMYEGLATTRMKMALACIELHNINQPGIFRMSFLSGVVSTPRALIVVFLRAFFHCLL